MLRLVSASIVTLFLVACGSTADQSETVSPKAPQAPKVAGKDPARSPSNQPPLSGVAPLPPVQNNPGAPNKPAPKPPAVAPDSVEGKFLASIQGGRWRTQCDRTETTSLFYGMEFVGETWSTMLFEYKDNNSCIQTAFVNEGVPKTYRISSMKLGADGWYVIEGSCTTAANACLGSASIAVKLDANNILQMKKVSASGTYFPADASEVLFDF